MGEHGWGWGFVVRDSNGDVVMAGVQQGLGFAGPEIEEAKAWIFGLKRATTAGINNLVIEGDCLALIQKLRAKQVPNNALGFFIQEILSLVSSCAFFVWSFVKRRGNRVAHDIAHWQPFCSSSRFWDGDIPDSINVGASEDLYDFFNLHLI